MMAWRMDHDWAGLAQAPEVEHNTLTLREGLGPDSLELEAKSIGIPSRRMRQMRRMGNRIIKRINHSPDMLINEYVSKCEKMMALDDSDLDMELLLGKVH